MEALVDHDVPTVLGTLRVRSAGSGPAMLMWPSLLMDGSLWLGQVEHFRDRFQVLAIDPPGHGASERLSRPFSFEECATAVVEVLDAFEQPRGHLLGNSWGGMIGGTFAARHPDRAGAAVLMNATASLAGRRQRLEYTALLAAARVLGGIRGPLVGSALKAFLGPTSLANRPDVVRHVRETVARADVRSASLAIRSVVPARPDQHALLSTIRTPVLVVAGREDATFPVEETRRMADAVPGARFVVLEDAAHLAALEVPAEFNLLVDDFLAEVG